MATSGCWHDATKRPTSGNRQPGHKKLCGGIANSRIQAVDWPNAMFRKPNFDVLKINEAPPCLPHRRSSPLDPLPPHRARSLPGMANLGWASSLRWVRSHMPRHSCWLRLPRRRTYPPGPLPFYGDRSLRRTANPERTSGLHRNRCGEPRRCRCPHLPRTRTWQWDLMLLKRVRSPWRTANPGRASGLRRNRCYKPRRFADLVCHVDELSLCIHRH